MHSSWQSTKRFLESEEGPTSVEYCFMMGFILLVCIAAVGELGDQTHTLYRESFDAMS